MQKILIPVLFFSVIAFASTAFSAEELEMINRPVNTSGMTGLLVTTAPFTVPEDTVEISLAALSEKSSVPDYSFNELPSLSFTYGLGEATELALKGSYLHKTSGGGLKERGAGDVQLSLKWNFLTQTESESWPSLAFILAGVVPSDSSSDSSMNIGGVTHWGARFGLSAGKEIIWGDHVIGIYADGQLVIHDLNNADKRDRSGLLNAGLLFPISKYRNLQMLIEYNMVTGVDRITSVGGDYGAITYGLRLVNERFNLSIGTQFLHKSTEGFDNSSRIIGMMSIKL